MTIKTSLTGPSRAARRRWVEAWDPEDSAFWDLRGRSVARRNLTVSMFTEHLAFGVWVVWTVVVLNLANAGIRLPLSDLFVLTMLPNLAGALLRIPYAAAVSHFGGRTWTVISGLLLLIPAGLLALVVPSRWLAHQSHSTIILVLGACAAASGLGGGNFASAMANISFFYPRHRQGWALGLNAAGGNLGVASTQLLVPLLIVVGVPAAHLGQTRHAVHLSYAGWVWFPLVLFGVLAAWRRMDDLGVVRSTTATYRRALSDPHTWVLSALYVGTFGSFIGFSFALPLIIRTGFPAFLTHHPFIATYLSGLGFLGALLGSLSRPAGGRLADRFGGARVTLAGFAGMAALTFLSALALEHHDFVGFLSGFCTLFVLSGMANGSVYKLIPTVFGSAPDAAPSDRFEHGRRTAGVIGIIGAVGALGGVLVQLAIRQASLSVSALEATTVSPRARAEVAAAHSAWCVPALATFLMGYLLLGTLTWVVYLRGSPDPVRLRRLVGAELSR